MGFLTKITHGAKNVDVRHKSGWLSHGLDTIENSGGAYLAARVNTQFGERAKFRGVEISYGLGWILKVGAILGDIFGYGDGWAPHANSIGQGLLSAHFASIGARHGLEARASSIPALPPKKETTVGAIPPAQGPGRWLDLDAVNRLADMHG